MLVLQTSNKRHASFQEAVSTADVSRLHEVGVTDGAIIPTLRSFSILVDFNPRTLLVPVLRSMPLGHVPTSSFTFLYVPSVSVSSAFVAAPRLPAQVDWRALVSFLQAAENEEDGINSKNDNNNASRDNLTDMAPDRRGRLHTTALPRRGNRPSDPFPRQHEREQQRQAQQRQRQNWATSSRAQRAVGGLFEGGGTVRVACHTNHDNVP